MKIREEQEEQIINMGAFQYGEERIARLLNADKEEVIAELSDRDSRLSRLVQKGRDMADYVIDLKLFEMTKKGDIKALDKLEKRRIERVKKL